MSLFFPLAFFAIAFLSLLSIAGSLAVWYTAFLGVGVILLLWLLRRKKKALCFAAVGVILVFLAAAFLGSGYFSDGLKILLNRLFEKSESLQRYRYEYFSISVVRRAYPARVIFAAALCSLPLATLSYFLSREKSGFSLCAAALSLVIVFAVFGVFPSGVLLALLFGVVLLYFLAPVYPLRERKGRIFLSVLGVFCVLIFALSALYRPSENIASLSERVRDSLSQTHSYSEEGEEGSGEGEGEQSGKSEGEGEDGSASELATTVSRVPVLLIVLGGVTLFALCSPAFLALKRRLGEKKKEKIGREGTPTEGILAYFSLTKEELQKRGFRFLNRGYRNYTKELSSRFGADYAALFSLAIPSLEEAIYSPSGGNEEGRKTHLSLYLATKELKRGRTPTKTHRKEEKE